MAEMRDLRPGGAGPRANLPARISAERKPRPDPGPLRIAIGLTGMATASALMTAFLGPAAGATPVVGTNTATGVSATDSVAAISSQAVRHVTRYVQLAPGQTPPPKAVVQQAPVPKPRVVVVTTRQSGK